MTDRLFEGFPPVWREDARILILGSLPSVLSLDAAEYYGNPRNAFWHAIEALTGVPAAAPYAERTRALQDRGLALWDVIGKARRHASADASIRAVEPNPIDELLDSMPHCTTIALNGGKARELWQRHLAEPVARAHPDRELTIHHLPSTSPAYAAMPRDEKIARWLDALRGS